MNQRKGAHNSQTVSIKESPKIKPNFCITVFTGAQLCHNDFWILTDPSQTVTKH